MKGVILAAGKGARLNPLTKTIPKVLLPIYDKPMIYYSIELLKQMEIKDVLIIVSSDNEKIIKEHLNDEDFGLKIEYCVQKEQNGSAKAFELSKYFVGTDDVVLIYGDNIFLTDNFDFLKQGLENLKNGYSSLFVTEVLNPSKYGVVEMTDGFVTNIYEKPNNPISSYISTGLYFYDCGIYDKIRLIDKSIRGEYELTDANKLYIKESKLKAVPLKDVSWYDAGTFDSLIEAALEVKDIMNRKE